jgi:hypothetical protein
MKAGVLGDSLAYSGADVEATKPETTVVLNAVRYVESGFI